MCDSEVLFGEGRVGEAMDYLHMSHHPCYGNSRDPAGPQKSFLTSCRNSSCVAISNEYPIQLLGLCFICQCFQVYFSSGSHLWHEDLFKL
jgi:hypothetical protein